MGEKKRKEMFKSVMMIVFQNVILLEIY
jgi:hypothetical protein